MSRQDQRKSLAEWTGQRTIHGPYSDGETAQDRTLRLEREEANRTARLIMQVLVTMAVLIVAYSVYWMFLR